MGNLSGLSREGLTIEVVAPIVREVLDSWFPGLFAAELKDGALLVTPTGQVEPLLAWWDEEQEDVPGFVGGKHPRIGQFGYWLLSVIELESAKKLGAQVYDEGIGYYQPEEVERGAAPTFCDFIKERKGWQRWWPSSRSLDRELVELSAPSLLPYFDTI